MLDTVPSPSVHFVMSVAGPVMVWTTESPANSPVVTLPVMVTINAVPTVLTAVLPVMVDCWPVFQLMVKVNGAEFRRSRQDSLG